MDYTNLVATFLLQGMQSVWCFDINIYGDTYIEAGVPYMATCNVSQYKDNRITRFYAGISNDDQLSFVIRHSATIGCYYVSNGTKRCQSSLCSCDMDGLATHWIYNTSADLSSPVTFTCASDNSGISKNSAKWIPFIANDPGSSVTFTPADELITKVMGQILGPIVCSAQCNPPCQFYWIRPGGSVVDGLNLEISSLSKNDHGTFTCHAGNGYGNNATKNLNVTVNYGPESVTLSPPITTYTVTEGDTIPSITCTASCRPQCTFMWTGPNVPDGTTNDLYLQNINRNQKGTFNCTATNEVGSNMSSTVEVDVQYGPGSSVTFTPADELITKVMGQILGPIVCSAQCNPPCQFYWIRPGGSVVDGLNLEISSLSKNDHGAFTCHAGNGYGNNATKNLNVTVNYGPDSVTLSPPNMMYIVTEGDTITSISCTASCRPQCTFMWTGPNVPDGTTNDLFLQNITRNQKGTFNCTATNEVGGNVSSTVKVDVQYQAKVENVAINTTNTVDENTTVMFSCLFEGNPAPIVNWSLNGKILQTTEGSTTVDSARCNNTGRYTCTASNSIGISTKELTLYVTCHPRNAIILDTTIAIIDKNATLNITVPIISYPQPTLIRWTFIQNGTTDLIDVDNTYITITYGVYQHVSQLIKDGLNESEYGAYSINVSNNIGPYFQHDFNVVKETIPDPPSNVSAVCDTSPFSTIISWRSEFDGGRAQQFHVWFEICCDNVHEFAAYSEERSDPGRNKYVSVEITSLQAATPYIFYVSSSNDYGSSNSTTVFCNTTTKSTGTEPNSAVVGIVAGTSLAIVLVIVVIVIVIIRRRRFASDIGLKDNTLYEPAGPDLDRRPASNGDENAVVIQKGNTFHANGNGTIQETAFHAEDKKKPKLGKKGQLDSNTRKANGKDGMKEYKHEDVNENMEDKVGSERSTCQPMDNRNKDGLQYADLMLNPSTNGARFIIHGIDDKTMYADVDTTQKIYPLPNSDVEDDQNNSKSNKTAE